MHEPGLLARAPHVDVLERALARARDGHPTWVALTGPPGIGKSSLLRAFGRRHRAVAGAAHEESAIPFLVVRPLLAALGVDHEGFDRPVAGAAAGIDVLAERTVDALRHRVGTPLTVLVDDVQWADRASCLLLEHVTMALELTAATGRPCPVLLVAACREQPPADPARLVDRLGRGPAGRRLIVGPLDDVAIAELARRHDGRTRSPADVRVLRELTGGNPLLTELVLHHQTAAPDPMTAPTMHAEIARLVEALGHEARGVLEVCAVHGDPLVLDVIARLVGAGALERCLDRAESAGVVSRVGDDVRFRHPEFGRRLRLGMDAARLAAAHGQLGLAMLADGPVGDRWLTVDAHLARAGPGVERSIRLAAARHAGARAIELGAWARAADALDVVGRHLDDLPAGDRAAAALEVGLAHAMDNQPAAAAPLFARAIELAAGADPVVWRDGVLRAVRNRLSLSPSAADRWPEVDALRAIVEDPPDAAIAVHGWVALADVAYVAHDERAGKVACAEARRAADRSGSSSLLALAEYADGLRQLGALEVHQAADSFDRCAAHADDAVVRCWGVARAAIAAFMRGEDDAAGRLDRAAERCADEQRWADQALVEAHRATSLAAAGELTAAEGAAESALLLFARTGYGPAAAIAVPQLACLRALRDDPAGVDDVVSTWSGRGWRPPGWVRALAATIHTRSPSERPTLMPIGPLNVVSALAYVARAELADSIDEREVQHVGTGLQAAFDRQVTWVGGWAIGTPRALATVSSELGHELDAARWLDVAETVATRATARTELAQVWLRMAQLQHAGTGSPGWASGPQLCLRAIELAERIGADAVARRAREELDRPSASAPSPAPRPIRSIMFTDIVASTETNVAVGDERFVALLDEHNDLLQQAARAHDGVVFHNTGDGYGIWFGAADDAVACALAIHTSLDRAGARHPSASLRVRIGIATGTPLSLGGDLFGVDVVRASRLCALTDAGGISVDARSVPRYVGPIVHPRGAILLKGFRQPEEVYRVAS